MSKPLAVRLNAECVLQVFAGTTVAHDTLVVNATLCHRKSFGFSAILRCAWPIKMLRGIGRHGGRHEIHAKLTYFAWPGGWPWMHNVLHTRPGCIHKVNNVSVGHPSSVSFNHWWSTYSPIIKRLLRSCEPCRPADLAKTFRVALLPNHHSMLLSSAHATHSECDILHGPCSTGVASGDAAVCTR